MKTTSTTRFLLAGALAAFCLMSTAGVARADFAPGDGAALSAETLKKDQVTIGLALHPTAVGFHDRVQLGSYLLQTVLGIPNLELKLKVIDGDDTDVTFVGSYMHGMDWGAAALMMKNTAIARGQVVAAHSFTPTLTFGLRGGVGRQMIHGDNEVDFVFVTMSTVEATLLDAGAYVDVKLDDRNMIYLQANIMKPIVDGEVDEDGTVNGMHAGDLRWDGRLGWTHVWGRLRTGVMLVAASCLDRDGDLPVRPFVDLWYTF